MTVEILALRGINVGGHRRMPMAEFRALLTGLGARQVATYIQSGNAVYRGPLAPAAISDAIEAEMGFRPAAQTRTLAEWQALVAGMPFRDVTDHKALHLFLTERESPTALSKLLALAAPGERLCRLDRAIWLHAPDYLAGSKLANRMEALLNVPTTARNWRTVTTLLDMAEALT